MEIQELYVDSLGLVIGPHTISLLMGNPGSNAPRIRVYLNHTVAKEWAMMLRHTLKAWEDEHGNIALTQNDMRTMGVAPEDW